MILCFTFFLYCVSVVLATGVQAEAAEGQVFTLGINNYMDSFEFCWKVHQNIEEWAEKHGIKTVYAEAAMDVDKPHQLELLRADMENK